MIIVKIIEQTIGCYLTNNCSRGCYVAMLRIRMVYEIPVKIQLNIIRLDCYCTRYSEENLKKLSYGILIMAKQK